jgi:putative ABC transport system substrate-binding protein
VLFDSTDADRSLGMATELVNRGVDAILAVGTEVALKSAVAATKTIPIVIQANDYDPLALGYIASRARPGGNVTGVFFQQIELTPKRLQLLTQTVPDLARVVALWDRLSTDQFEAARSAAQGLKITLDGIECTDPPYDYERLLAGVEGRRRDVLLQVTSPLFFQYRQRLSAVALAHRLPSMFAFRQWVDAGGLMSYSASPSDMGRLLADYVDRIAKGAKPADLPVQQPTKFELVINLKTANALGLTIPPSILERADAVIE